MNRAMSFFSMFRLALALAGVLLLGRHAAMADDRASCFSQSFAPLDVTIPGCNRLIASGKLEDQLLYRALVARAEALDFAQTYHFGHTIDAQALLESEHADLDRAVEIARRLHAQDETYLELLQYALAERAGVSSRLGRDERAVQDYSESIGFEEPPRLTDLLGRSYALERLGRLQAAIADMSAVIQMSEGNSNRANWFSRRAELLEAAGDTEAAMADYRRTLTLMPDHTVANRALQRLTVTP